VTTVATVRELLPLILDALIGDRAARETKNGSHGVLSAAEPQPNASRFWDAVGVGKSGGCKTKPHQDRTAFQKSFIVNLAETSRLF
jgi:hypothetical protein